MKTKRRFPWTFSFLAYPLLASTFAMMVCPVSAEEIDEAVKSRFLRDAPGKWKEFKERAEKLQGTCTGEVTNSVGNEKGKAVTEYKANEKCKLFKLVVAGSIVDGKAVPGYEEMFGVNKEYAFKLRRKSAENGWAVSQIINLQKEKLPDEFARRFEHQLFVATEPARLWRETLPEMLEKPYFRITRCRAIKVDDQELVEVMFDYRHEVDKDSWFQGGMLVLDPNRFWCVRSYDLRTKTSGGEGRMTNKVEWNRPMGDFPLVSGSVRVIESQLVPGSKGTYRNRYQVRQEMDFKIPKRLPADSEFKLSAFDLPEPFGAGTGGASLRPYHWAGIVGGVCLTFGAGISWLRRRFFEPVVRL